MLACLVSNQKGCVRVQRTSLAAVVASRAEFSAAGVLLVIQAPSLNRLLIQPESQGCRLATAVIQALTKRHCLPVRHNLLALRTALGGTV